MSVPDSCDDDVDTSLVGHSFPAAILRNEKVRERSDSKILKSMPIRPASS